MIWIEELKELKTKQMSEWKEYSLSEAVELITGFPFKGDKYEMKGNLKVVRGENVTLGTLRWDSEKYWNHSTEDLEKYFLKTDDIVIGMDGSRVGQNRAIIRTKELPLILAQRVARLRAKKNFDQKFIWYQIYSKRFMDYVDAIQTGTSIPHISPSLINDFEISAPDYIEQKAIAETISSLDDKIDLLHRQNKTLEQLAETLFRQWFVEEVEESWEEVQLSDIVLVKYGKDHKKLGEGKIPAFGSGGLMRYVDTPLYTFESVLIPRKGTLNNVMYIDEPFWTVDTMFYTEMKKPNLAKFVYHFLKRLDLASMNVGSAVPSMTTEVLNNMLLSIPSDEVFAEFELVVSECYQKIKFNNKQIVTLTKLRDILLPKLMSGEVRIKN